MTEAAPIRIEHLDTVTVVTLDRPDVRNAVDDATARALHAAFVAFEADEAARVAVLHGAHGHFCAGWDLKSGARMAPDAAEQVRQIQADLDFDAADALPRGPMGPSRL